MRPRFSEFGISRLARLTGLDHLGIPVWAAIRPNALTLASAQGKGLTDAAAAASAVMEAVEVACAERMAMPSREAAIDELVGEGDIVLPLDELLSEGANPIGAACVDWIEGFDLRTNRRVWVPWEAVSLVKSAGVSRFWQSTDGLASGNIQDEATFHGLCERIERDALILWRLRSDSFVASRCVQVASLGNEAVDHLAALVSRAGLFLRLFDLTTDIFVPVCFATISRVPDGNEGNWTHFDLSSGSGCHPDFSHAAIRAITEAAQTRLTTIAASRDDFEPALYRQLLSDDLLVYLRAEPNRMLHPGQPGPVIALKGHIAEMVEAVRAAGAGDIAVVPLTLPGESFAVVKVVAPGLESPSGRRRRPYGRRALHTALEGL